MNLIRLCLLIYLLSSVFAPAAARAAECLGDAGGIESLCPLPDTPRPRATEHEMTHLKPSDDGSHAVFQAICSQCHHWNIVVTSPKEDWTATITDMKHNGAEMTDEHRGVIIKYLNENYISKRMGGN